MSKSNRIDMLNGSLWDRIFVFALPLAATGVLQQLFNASDIAVVGRFSGELGSASMAAVGANSPIVGLLVNLFVGMALGTNVVIARAVGQRDTRTVSRAVHTSIVFALLAGVIGAIVCEALAGVILRELNVPEEVLPLAETYLRIYAAGLPVILLYNFEAAIFRAVGDTRTPLIALAASGVVNVLLNLFFVIVFDMNVAGVAAATVIANFLSSGFLLRQLLRTESDVRVTPSRLRIDRPVFAQILRIGVPAGIQSAVFSFANIIVQSAINSLGMIVMAASSAAFNVEIIAFYVLNAFGQACTTFVGQNQGAEQYRRCRRVLVLCLVEDALCLALTIFAMLFFGRSILGLFNTDPQVIELGYTRMVIILSSYGFSMLYDTMAGYLRGFGISFTPALLTTLGICGVRIFWIACVFLRYETFAAVLYVYPISLGLTAVLIGIALLVLRPAHRHERAEKSSR